jgi:hypothetical protein
MIGKATQIACVPVRLGETVFDRRGSHPKTVAQDSVPFLFAKLVECGAKATWLDGVLRPWRLSGSFDLPVKRQNL